MIGTIFKKLVNIVPAEDTYFTYVEKPKPVKFSKEVIILNYKSLSPFENGDLLYLQTKKNIYIWFTKHRLIDKKIHIPEGYLIYKRFKREKNASIIYNKSKDKSILLIVKNHTLVSQLVSRKENLEQKVDLLIKEHSLKNPKKIIINSQKMNLTILDILEFSNFEINKENLIEFGTKFILMPISIVLIINGIFYVAMNSYLKEKINEKKIYLQQLKEKNKDIKSIIYQLEEKKVFWQEFIIQEKNHPSFHYILNEIAKVIKSNNGYINRLEFEGNFLSIWAGLRGNTSLVVQSLLDTELFKDIKIVSSVKDRKKEGYEIINMEIYLK